jgi:hypothetical protein
MSNTLLTNDEITNESLAVLENEIVFAKKVARPVDNMFGNQDHQNGDTVKLRLPDRGTYRSGATFSADDITESSVDITLSQGGADCNFTTKELTLDIAEFSERILKPRIVTIANEIDRQGLALYDDIYNQVGTPGTAPNAASFILDAGVKLDNNSAPRDGERYAIWSPGHNASLVGGLSTLFQSSGKIGDQYEKGLMGKGTLGFDHFMSQNTPAHTVGSAGATGAVTGTVSSGTSIVTDSWTTGTLAIGDIITVADVYAVNPITGQSTGQLMQFTLTAAVTTVGGVATLSVSPSIVTTGKFKNVSAAVTDGAVVTKIGTASTAYPISMAFHRDAFAFAMGQLYLPDGVDKAARKSYNGMSIRMVRSYDVNNDKLPTRLDVLFGWTTARAAWACRVIG